LDWRIVGFIALAGAATTAVFLHAPIPQPQAYHHFADVRTFLGVPNSLNVLSNLGFLIVGIWGVFVVANRVEASERVPYFVLFIGILLTAFGSAYYHWSPSNARLVWDRLPMTFGFMGLFAAFIGERIGITWQRWSLWPLVAIGIASVVYWYWSETQGHGDLRLYVLVQFFPVLGILFLMVFFPARYTKGVWMIGVVALYALAKVFEGFDRQIYAVTGVGGHPLKHVAAATATALLAWMLLNRAAVTSGSLTHSAGV
jgi:hypothetical protein